MSRVTESHESGDLVATHTPPLTREEASERLRVSTRTVDRLIADGDLKASKVRRQVRIEAGSVEALLSPSSPVEVAS